MLDVEISNSWTMEEVYKNELNILRLRYNKVNLEAAFDDHPNTWKCSQNMFLSNFEDLKCGLKIDSHYI